MDEVEYLDLIADWREEAWVVRPYQWITGVKDDDHPRVNGRPRENAFASPSFWRNPPVIKRKQVAYIICPFIVEQPVMPDNLGL